MRECFVSFASAADVQAFVAIATKQFFSIQVERGNMLTSGKSILGLFSMGMNCPLRVVIQDPEADVSPFMTALQPYLVA